MTRFRVSAIRVVLGTLAITPGMAGPAPACYLTGLQLAGVDPPAGVAALETCLRAEPEFGPAYRRLAILSESVAPERADAFFTALANDGRSPGHGALGLGWIAFNRQDWAAARTWAARAVSLRPTSAATHLLWNRAAAATRDIAELRAYYERRLAGDSRDTVARFGLPHLLVWGGQRTAAHLEAMETVVRERPTDRNYVDAWLMSEYMADTGDRALGAARQTVDWAARSEDGDLKLLATSLAASLLFDDGALRESAVTAAEAAGDARRLADRAVEARMELIQCVARMALGDVPEARRRCEAAVDRSKGIKVLATVASDALSRLAAMNERRGDLQGALEAHQRAIDAAGESGFPITRVNRRMELASKLADWGQAKEAEAMAVDLIAAAKASGAWNTEAVGLMVLARSRAAQGRRAEAAADVKRSLSVARGRGARLLEQRLLSDAAAMSPGSTLAMDEWAEFAREANARGELGVVANLELGMGHAALRSSAPAAARGHFQRALEAAQASGRAASRIDAWYGLGLSLEQMGLLREALDPYRNAIAAAVRERESLADPGFRAPLFALRQDAYRRAASLMAAAGDPAGAFELWEEARARMLLDHAATENVPPNPSHARFLEELSRKESRLLTTVLSLRSTAADRAEALRAADRAATEYALNKALQPRLGSSASRTVTAADLRDALDAGTAVLEYLWSGDGAILFVVTREGLSAHRVAANAESLITELNSYLAGPPRRVDEARTKKLLTSLHASVLGPAAAALRGKSRWIVCADGPLQRVPFSALLTGPAPGPGFTKAPFVVRRAAILRAPSATAWMRMRTIERESAAGVAVFADPAARRVSGAGLWRAPDVAALPYTRAEAEAIRRIWGRAAQLRLGAMATANEARTLLASSAVAHFAVHAFNDPRRGRSSGLVLAPSGNSQIAELLQAWEIQEMRLPLHLVVLSACETSSGPELPGEGSEALSRAFLVAGVADVVGSLWRVNDEATAGLMARFHRRYRDGARTSEALRDAQLRVLGQEGTQHPFYWAAFEAWGIDSTVPARAKH